MDRREALIYQQCFKRVVILYTLLNQHVRSFSENIALFFFWQVYGPRSAHRKNCILGMDRGWFLLAHKSIGISRHTQTREDVDKYHLLLGKYPPLLEYFRNKRRYLAALYCACVCC